MFSDWQELNFVCLNRVFYKNISFVIHPNIATLLVGTKNFENNSVFESAIPVNSNF